MSLSQCLVTLMLLISLLAGLSAAVADEVHPVCKQLDLVRLHDHPTKKTRCFHSSFKSVSLNGREIPYTVIVPAGYAKSRAMPYAIFLHGRGGSENQILEIGALNAIKEHKFLIVAPAGGDHYWMNAAISKEKWGDMVAKDLVAHVEATFATTRNKAIFGLSMGGNGTIQLGLSNPKTFRTALAISPVFRRENEIWKPGSELNEPHDDYDSYGEGDAYRARSVRHLCEKVAANGPCLPFENFKLEMGKDDPLMDKYADTRVFIGELKQRHPEHSIEINVCNDAKICKADKACNAHTHAYWSCRLPGQLDWLAKQLGVE